jgi:hypothetical protein
MRLEAFPALKEREEEKAATVVDDFGRDLTFDASAQGDRTSNPRNVTSLILTIIITFFMIILINLL